DRANQSIGKAQEGFDKALEAIGKADTNADDIVTIRTDNGKIYTRIESVETQLSDIDTSGRNLITHLPSNWELGGINDVNGNPVTNPSSLRTKVFTPIDSSQEYSVADYDTNVPNLVFETVILLYDKQRNFIISHKTPNAYHPQKTTFTTPATAGYFKVTINTVFYFEEIDEHDIGIKFKIKMNEGDLIESWAPNFADTG